MILVGVTTGYVDEAEESMAEIKELALRQGMKTLRERFLDETLRFVRGPLSFLV